MLKVLTLVGTRPELIKLSRVIVELDRHVDHVLVHTGQNYDYELNEVFFRELGIRAPDHFLAAAGESAAETIGLVIARLDKVLAAERPDAFLLLGDTNSCLGVIAAKRRRIPVFHMEAGNRCFDQRVPEEINRRIVDHTSDINLVYTEHARRYLLNEGFPGDRIIKTGSPMAEVLEAFAGGIAASNVLQRLALDPAGYFLVSLHREENVDASGRLTNVVQTLASLATEFDKQVICSIHPRTRRRLEAEGIEAPTSVTFMRPLGFFDYVHLQKHAFCVVSDSGTVTEESAILGFPAVTIREAHERPEGMDEGTLVMSGLRQERVVEGVRIVTAHRNRRFRVPPDYEARDVSAKVVRSIVSYTDFVKRTVWSET